MCVCKGVLPTGYSSGGSRGREWEEEESGLVKSEPMAWSSVRGVSIVIWVGRY